jgi:hypothetical protein
MTHTGGIYDSGCIFSVNTNGSGYKDLFDFTKKNGYYPFGSVMLSGNRKHQSLSQPQYRAVYAYRRRTRNDY